MITTMHVKFLACPKSKEISLRLDNALQMSHCEELISAWLTDRSVFSPVHVVSSVNLPDVKLHYNPPSLTLPQGWQRLNIRVVWRTRHCGDFEQHVAAAAPAPPFHGARRGATITMVGTGAARRPSALF